MGAYIYNVNDQNKNESEILQSFWFDVYFRTISQKNTPISISGSRILSPATEFYELPFKLRRIS